MGKTYYHITEQDWGDNVVLYPKNNGSNRDSQEPTTSRICVCDSIGGCFVSVYWWQMKPNIKLYRTKNAVNAIETFGVLDSDITGEHWLTEPTEFVFQQDFVKNGVLHDLLKNSLTEISAIFDHGGLLGSHDPIVKQWQQKYKSIINNHFA